MIKDIWELIKAAIEALSWNPLGAGLKWVFIPKPRKHVGKRRIDRIMMSIFEVTFFFCKLFIAFCFVTYIVISLPIILPLIWIWEKIWVKRIEPKLRTKVKNYLRAKGNYNA